MPETREIEYNLSDPRTINRGITLRAKLSEGESLFDALKNMDECAVRFIKEALPLDVTTPELPAKFQNATQHPNYQKTEKTAKTTEQNLTFQKPLDSGWRPWKSGKGGESKPANEEPDFTDLLMKGEHKSTKPYDAPDNYRYWYSTNDADGNVWLQRIRVKKP